MNLLNIAGRIYQKYQFGNPPNLIGDRDLEYAFIAANLTNGGNVLDFGSGVTPLILISLMRNSKVTAIDLLPNQYKFKANIKYIKDDILKTKKLKSNNFDTIINCSSIEHVGLRGRYGVKKDVEDGDLKAMEILKKLLKKGGRMILTIPVGIDKTVDGMHRIYGKDRLPKLLNDFKISKQQYWIKNSENLWYGATKDKALEVLGSAKYYGIGCFVLKK